MKEMMVPVRKHTIRVVVLAALVGLFAAIAAFAQNVDYNRAFVRYDVDSTNLTFCRTVGQQNSTFLGGILGTNAVKTVGSSATVSSNTGSAGALTPVVVTDVLTVRPTAGDLNEPFGAGYAAIVTAKADNDNVTVDPAVNWSAVFNYQFYHPVCGTTANDGWVDVSGASRVDLAISYDQGDLDALAWRFECKKGALGSVPIQVYPNEGDGCGNAGTQSGGFCEFATAGSTANFVWEEFGTWSACRIGVKVKTTDTSDAGANLERVSGSISVARGNQ